MTTAAPRLPLEPPPLIEHTVSAQMRDPDLNLLGWVQVTFVYDPIDPYALHLDMADPANPWQGVVRWTGARDTFLAAALWNCETPMMDLVVRPVTLTKAIPGQRTRDVPSLRVSLHPVFGNCEVATGRGRPVHFDLDLTTVKAYLRRTLAVVPTGSESRMVDWDALADFLGGPR